jgi:Gene product 88
MIKLSFGKGNNKLGASVYTFSLPAGWTCPGARDCLAKVGLDGKLTDGPDTQFRCFAASMEARMPSVRNSRRANLDALKALGRADTSSLIDLSLPRDAKLVRIHVSGDFFNESYFLAWCDVARLHPETTFYAYTKSINLWIKHLAEIPANLKLTASYGGRFDELIVKHNLKRAYVVFTLEQAEKMGLEIDHDDSHAFAGDKSFALLLHGTQPKASVAAKALSALKAAGHTGYGKTAAA